MACGFSRLSGGELGGCEVRGEDEGQALLCGQRRAEGGGAENVQRDIGALARDGAYPLLGCGRIEVAPHLRHLRRKVLGAGLAAAQGLGRPRVGARSSPDTEVDAPREEGGKGAELLGDHVRGVVGEHDATGADLDPFGGGGHLPYENGGRGGRHRGHVVVFGDPVAVVAELLCLTGEFDGLEQCLGGRALAVPDGGEVEQGERNVAELLHGGAGLPFCGCGCGCGCGAGPVGVDHVIRQWVYREGGAELRRRTPTLNLHINVKVKTKWSEVRHCENW